ncbi:MAG: sugar transferase [Anaerolineae bacterium]
MSEVTLSHTRTRWWALQVSERRILLMLVDLLAISCALGVAVWVRIPGVSESYDSWRPFFLDQLRWWLLLWALWLPASLIAGCYDLRIAASVPTSAVYTAACALVVAVLYLLVPWMSAPLTWSRLAWFIFAGLSMGSVVLWRIIYATLLAQDTFSRRALVVGASEAGAALAKAVDEAGKASGIELVGFLDDRAIWGQKLEGRPVVAGSEQLLSIARLRGVDEIVVAVGASGEISQELFQALVRCWQHGLSIVSMPMFYEEVAGAIPLEHVGRDMFVLVDHHRGLELRVWDLIRRIADIVVGLAGLLITAPILPIVALAIHLDSPGPTFYTQERVGQGGRRFRVIKLRSMVPNAEAAGAVWAQADDPRITRVGRFIRRTRIDELPQLWNVLKGEMTLIGPRPERPEFVQELDELLPYYAIRHSIKPGITGWAQVRYRYGNCVDDARMKLQYDLYYVKRRGPVLDVLIALTTLRVMVTMRGT